MDNSLNKKSFDAVIFDLDGIITRTAEAHAKAWKTVFDEYLRLREQRNREPFREFTHENDYLPFIDGKLRYKGVEGFLESRGISLPFGDPSDSQDKETVCGIGNKKNAMLVELLRTEKVRVYESTLQLIKELKNEGIRVGVASSSKNCQQVLRSAGIEDLFETRVDGIVSSQLGLRGKPEGDIFVRASLNLGTVPARAVVVEDALSGVQAGRSGAFGLIIGVARRNNELELLQNGADVAVNDLSQMSVEWCKHWFEKTPHWLHEAFDSEPEIPKGLEKNRQAQINPWYKRSAHSALFSGKRLVFFLDYDGTLTPIVDRPELALISDEMREIILQVSQKYTTAIVSGRMRQDVQNLVGIEKLIYAGSHGFDIAGPNLSMIYPHLKDVIPVIDRAIAEFKEKLSSIEEVLIEEKKFSVAVHYRLVDEKFLPQIQKVVENVVKENDALRLMQGKKVFEVLPLIDWNKGKAVSWLMEALSLSWDDTSVVYLGDDTTDEDAFRVIRTRGTGILVSATEKPSAADFRVSSPDKVKELFKEIIALS